MIKLKNLWQNHYGLILGWFVLAALNISKLGRLFTTDEVWNIKAISLPWGEMLSKIINDVHPPLFFVVQKAYGSIFGISEISLHTFSLVLALASVWAFHMLLKELLKNEIAINLGTILLALSPLFLSQAIFARWYSFFALISLLSYWLFFKVIDQKKCSKKTGISYIITLVLGIYTNYLMIPVIGLQFLTGVYIKKTQKRLCHVCPLIVGAVVAFILFLPWLWTLSSQLDSGLTRYLDDVNIALFFKGGYFIFNHYLGPLIFVGNYALILNLLVIFFLLSVGGFIKMWQMKNRNAHILVVHSAILAAVMIIQGLILPHYLVYINFIFLLPLIYLIKIFSGKKKIIPFILILLLWTPSLYNFVTEKDWHITNAIDDWETVITYAKENPECQKIVIDNSDILEFYFEKEGVTNYKFIKNKIDIDSSKCTLLIRTYLGKWKEGYHLCEDKLKFLSGGMKLHKQLFLSQDENWKEKNKILGDSLMYTENRIELYHFMPQK